MKIIRNSAKCLNCGDEIVSLHRHDYKSCTCYLKSCRILKRVPKYKTYTKKGDYRKSYLKLVSNMHGITVDGGKEYLRHGWYNANDYKNTSIWR